MNNIINCDLTSLVDPPRTDSISGRAFGEKYAESIKLIEKKNSKEFTFPLIENGSHFLFFIDDTYVKAINDSFIKGLFSEIFKKYKTIDNVKSFIAIDASDYYKRLFEKNWYILQEINNV